MDWSLGSFGDLRLDNGGGTLLEQMVARKTVCRSLSSEPITNRGQGRCLPFS